MKDLLKSKKFWVLALGLLAVVAQAIGLPEAAVTGFCEGIQ